MKSERLENLFRKYDIRNLPYGKLGDKLGDVFQDFVIEIFEDKRYIEGFEGLDEKEPEEKIFKTILTKEGIVNIRNVSRIEATSNIPKRNSGGDSKTDVLIKVYTKIGQVINIPVSIKQTTANKVSFAEFDVNTILREVGIVNPIVERLMTKHQTDGSAKNFTAGEKQQLRKELEPYKEKLLRWIVTMDTTENKSDIRIPIYVIKFKLNRNYHIIKTDVYNIDEYIRYISTNKNGSPALGGFGTGLSWTYATGSKGTKIQFKG